MRYQNCAIYDNAPPKYGYEGEAFYDQGQGVPKINANNMTIQDIYRTPFLFLQDHNKNYDNVSTEALSNIQSNSELSKLFFSDENFKRIQKLLKAEVFRRTNKVFRVDVDQEQMDLFLVMRATYLEQARNLPGQTVRQVKRLNQKVVESSVPGMISAIKQEIGYNVEINKPLSPIDRELNVNNRGRRTLPGIYTTFGA